MKNRFIVIVLVLMGNLGFLQNSLGQDPLFSQYFSAPLYYNPALTGIGTGLRVRFNYRDQWPALPTDYQAYFFSADLGDRNLPGSGGLGLMVNADNEGIGFMHNLEVALNLSVRIPITKSLVSQVGIKASVKQKTVNWDDFVFTDELSEKYGDIYQSEFIPPDANKRVFPDFAAGGVLQYANEESNVSGIAGFSVNHIFQPDESFLTTGSAPLPRKWVGHLDLVITAGGESSSGLHGGGSGDPLKINPGIMFISQSKLNALQAGLTLLKYNIYLGGWYKGTLSGNASSAVVVLAGYRYMFSEGTGIKFMYSYDIPVAGAMMGTGGAHEISLVLEFDKLSIFGGRGGYGPAGRSKSGYSPIDCPVFY